MSFNNSNPLDNTDNIPNNPNGLDVFAPTTTNLNDEDIEVINRDYPEPHSTLDVYNNSHNNNGNNVVAFPHQLTSQQINNFNNNDDPYFPIEYQDSSLIGANQDLLQLGQNQLTIPRPTAIPEPSLLSQSVLPDSIAEKHLALTNKINTLSDKLKAERRPETAKKQKKRKEIQAPKTRPAFVLKVWNMVNDPMNHEFINWSQDGKSFHVTNREFFMKSVLPRYFKHSNFASFVRQLNMYGWHKVQDISSGTLTSNDEQWQFENENFIKDREDLLDNIVRSKSAKNNDEDEVDLGGILSELETIKMNQIAISEDLRRVRKDNETLWKENYIARERHNKQAETLDKILHFLATVYGNSSKVLGVDNNPYNQTLATTTSNQVNLRNPTSAASEFAFPAQPNYSSKPMLMLTQNSHNPTINSSRSNSKANNKTDESPVQEIERYPSRQENRPLNRLQMSGDVIPSPRALFPELTPSDSIKNDSLDDVSQSSISLSEIAKMNPNLADLDDNISKQEHSIQQVEDWINKMVPTYQPSLGGNDFLKEDHHGTHALAMSPMPPSIAGTEFDVNEFLNPSTPHELSQTTTMEGTDPNKRVVEMEDDSASNKRAKK